jgi:hypothetical protein
LFSPDYVGYGTLIAGVAAVGTVIWAIYQYSRGLVIQRQKVLFDHIEDLNKPGEFDLAKKLLGYGFVEIPNGAVYYSVDDESRKDFKELQFLKTFKKDSIYVIPNPDELKIKESLDSFIAFIGKVGYSLSVGAIAPNEIIYFQYWISKIISNPTVTGYISNNEFPLYTVLLKELAKDPGIFSKRGKSYPYLRQLQTLAAKEKIAEVEWASTTKLKEEDEEENHAS